MKTSSSSALPSAARFDRVTRIGLAVTTLLALALFGTLFFRQSNRDIAVDAESVSLPPISLVVPKADDCSTQPLVFDSVTLSDAVDLINQCNGPALIIDDDALSAVRISGLVHAAERESFVYMLEQMEMATATPQKDGTIVLDGFERPLD